MSREEKDAPPRRRRAGWKVRLAFFAVAFFAVYGVAAWGGWRAGNFLMADQPSVRELQDPDFALASKVHASDGELVYSFAQEKRDYAEYEEISPWLIQGLVATEDEQFWEHRGLNYQGILRAALHDLKASIEAGRLVFPQGGSSLTQQLAKQLYLDPEKKIKRKIEEALLALQIEKNFKKEEILEMYLNQVFLGHRRHGVEAAARYYFGVGADELTLPQAALLAGLPQRPSAYSPRNHPEAALARRNKVLRRMAEVGYITQEQMTEARAAPLGLVRTETERRIKTQQAAPYFVEEIRRELVDRVGDAVNTGGLVIRTTLDMDLQRKATRAVRDGLRDLDQRHHGFRPIEHNLIDEGESPESFEHPAWLVSPDVDGVVTGVVLSVDDDRAVVRVGEDLVLEAGPETIRWTKRRRVSDVLRRGDVAPFLLETDEETGETRIVRLEQHPPFEGALVAIDVATGEIRAMVGGYDYSRSEFNKVTQARRQVGSAFKPIYYAAALENGLPPTTTVVDEPTVFLDSWTGEAYAPENYYKSYHGQVTLREALERSLNIASVRLLNTVGYDPTIELARKFGITAPLKPYPSMALGAMEVTLLEMTSAYSVFPNMGLWVEPTLIRSVKDPKGNVVLERSPRLVEVVSPETAFQMVHLLRGVVQHGTGKKAKKLDRPVAGKTGTTDDYSDAWFIGFTPTMAVGVWVGWEEELRPICRKCAGSEAALPIWIDFLDQAIGDTEPQQFVDPGGIEFVAIDRKTGLRASFECPKERVFLEALRSDERPPPTCTEAHHRQVELPKCLQGFPIDSSGVLIVPSEARLLQLEQEMSGCQVVVDPIRRIVELPGEWSPSGPTWLPYRVGFGSRRPMLSAPAVEDLLERDRRTVRSRGGVPIGDLDVLDGRRVVVVRNDDSRYR